MSGDVILFVSEQLWGLMQLWERMRATNGLHVHHVNAAALLLPVSLSSFLAAVYYSSFPHQGSLHPAKASGLFICEELRWWRCLKSSLIFMISVPAFLHAQFSCMCRKLYLPANDPSRASTRFSQRGAWLWEKTEQKRDEGHHPPLSELRDEPAQTGGGFLLVSSCLWFLVIYQSLFIQG